MDEVPAYEPSGEGDHLYIQIEKTDRTTQEALKTLAGVLQCPVREFGTAGTKDRRAVTTQWVSCLDTRQHWSEDRVRALAEPLQAASIRVLSVSRHTNKLKTGHLHANTFRVVLRGLQAPPDEAQERVDAIAEHIRRVGLPNAYGPQRFGRGLSNIPQALKLLRKPRAMRNRSPFQRRMLASSLQSALFNAYLTRRIQEGALHTALTGDLFANVGSNRTFTTDDLSDAQARMDDHTLSPTGPMPGPRMPAPDPATQAGHLEDALYTETLRPEDFGPFGKNAHGTRRHILVHVPDLQVHIEQGCAHLSFTLPPGSYASLVAHAFQHAHSPTHHLSPPESP